MTTYQITKSNNSVAQPETTQKNVKMNTVKHIAVTPMGISNDQLDMLSSEIGKKAVYKTAIFSATQNLLNNASKLQKFNNYINRLESQGMKDKVDSIKTTPRFTDLQDRATAAATKLACLDALAEMKSLDIPIELTPVLRTNINEEQLASTANFARMSVDELRKIKIKQLEQGYTDNCKAVATAEHLFYGASIEDEVEVKDEDGYTDIISTTIPVFFHPESVLKELTKARNWIASWNSPDITELGILADDIDATELALVRFNEITEQAGEGSREMDSKGATDSDLQQGSGI